MKKNRALFDLKTLEGTKTGLHSREVKRLCIPAITECLNRQDDFASCLKSL